MEDMNLQEQYAILEKEKEEERYKNIIIIFFCFLLVIVTILGMYFTASTDSSCMLNWDINNDGKCDRNCDDGSFGGTKDDGICDRNCDDGSFGGKVCDGICDRNCDNGEFGGVPGDDKCDKNCDDGSFDRTPNDGICDRNCDNGSSHGEAGDSSCDYNCDDGSNGGKPNDGICDLNCDDGSNNSIPNDGICDRNCDDGSNGGKPGDGVCDSNCSNPEGGVVGDGKFNVTYMNDINVKDIIPGWSGSQKFILRNNSGYMVTYSINLLDVVNTFRSNNFVFTLKKDGETLIDRQPTVRNDGPIYEGLTINTGESANFELIFEFIETNQSQNEDINVRYYSRIEIRGEADV